MAPFPNALPLQTCFFQTFLHRPVEGRQSSLISSQSSVNVVSALMHSRASLLAWTCGCDPGAAFGPRVVCTSCGIIGADARSNWREQQPFARPECSGRRGEGGDRKLASWTQRAVTGQFEGGARRAAPWRSLQEDPAAWIAYQPSYFLPR
jgi:hypothetical protein